MLRTAVLLLCSLCAVSSPLSHGADAPAKADGAKAESKPEEKIPEAKVSVTKHQVHIGATTLAYTATAGTMQMKNEKDEPIALFGFTAYVKDGTDIRTRPILFAYNGGPGSASAWLHMGILGPKRTVLTDVDSNTRGPFRTVDNEFSVLDQADLVMIDPARMLNHHDRIGAWRHGRARHDFERMTSSKRREAAIAGAHLAGYAKHSGNIVRADREAIAERAVERRIIAIRQNIFRENAAIGALQR